ncbi:MAG: lysophospholipid acyltransferase family protein [Eubacteriales bacterium]
MFSKSLQYNYTFQIGRFWSNTLLFLAGTKLEVYGKDNIPNGPVLFVGNHRSWFDIPIVFKTIPYQAGFLVKDEIRKIPLFNWWISSVGCLFLDRKDVRKAMKTILTGVKYLKNGQSLVIFPEGTRCKLKNEMHTFKQGSLKLAEKANVAIVPFAINKSDYILERNGLNVKSTNASITFGAPITLNDLDTKTKKNSAHYVQSIVKEMLKTSD